MHLSNPIPPDIQFFPKLSLIINIISSTTVSQQNILPTTRSITQISYFSSLFHYNLSSEIPKRLGISNGINPLTDFNRPLMAVILTHFTSYTGGLIADIGSRITLDSDL